MFASGKAASVSAEANYIEDVFSTYLYTGNGSTQTITNGIDLAGKGGLVWWKNRTNATGHGLIDTTRGIDYYFSSNTTDAQDGPVSYISSVSSTGYSIGAGTQFVNQSANNYVSWTFRKQPKFFDVVTYTGNGTNNKTISHSLASTPGCIIVKRTDSTGDWYVYHRGVDPTLAYGYFMVLNTTAARAGAPAVWDGNPTSTTFTVQDGTTNISGANYVAYLFAHNAGGFGLTGTDNVISCGSLTTDGSGNGSVTLGYEPQWLLVKRTDDVSQWYLADNMRGMPVSGDGARLFPNLSNAESTSASWFRPNATGFTVDSGMFASAVNLIYIAIRRGPMKVPTDATKVFAPALGTSASTIPTFVTNFPVDLGFYHSRANTADWFLSSRLQGGGTLSTNTTFAETVPDANYTFDSNTGWGKNFNSDRISFSFKRAPSFFDEVCYTGTGSAGRAVTHNLGVAPELVIVKNRSVSGDNWEVLCAFGTVQRLRLNLTTAGNTSVEALFGDGSSYIAPTSTTFTVANLSSVNGSGSGLVAYLFATCAGVSKCFNYTGNGSSQTINCGFTGGARWILIKRTDSTGDWYCWDSARGIVSGNDPHLSLNTTAAEVTSDDTIDTDSTGFVVNQVSATNVNVSSATYIGIAIA